MTELLTAVPEPGRGVEDVPAPCAIEISHVFKVFGRRPSEAAKLLREGKTREQVQDLGTAAVIDASFQVQKGEIFVVMGLSGSGKSTLIRMLNGLNPTTEGSIKAFGTEVVGLAGSGLRNLRRDHISMVFQHFALLPHRTVLDNVAYGLEQQGVARAERTERARNWLARVGLSDCENRYPRELSGGMKQRVGIARAFAADTDILLMDEAFSALDPLIRREMQILLAELQNELNKTIVFITHDLNEAMFLGDRIAVMRDGRLVQIGTPKDILNTPADEYVARFVQDVDRSRVLTAADVMEQPRAVVQESEVPQLALEIMRDQQTSTLFVIRDKRLVGIVRDEMLIEHLRGGGRDLRAVVLPAPATAGPKQVLAELISDAVATPLALPVLDDERCLLGVVPRIALFASLSLLPISRAEIPTIEEATAVPLQVIKETIELIEAGQRSTTS